jgi:alkanesulfonate monooxygenase SsuD/methylene tetrahydromethanopterin reductase-like flavin-dependent oxidoreductase (luciferase family)
VRQPVEFGCYIPQVNINFEQLLERARQCEDQGWASMWLYDHLYSPGLPQYPSLEGWTVATALLAQTTQLRIGHLVLNNNFRHPALLARMATTLDIISHGRLEFGIGSGSYEAEHHEGGFPWGSLTERSERLAEALEIITRMFSGQPTTFEGQHYQVHQVPNLPLPAQQPRPPIHVGGIGERHTLPLVARYADVWNVPTYGLSQWPDKVSVLRAECEKIQRDPATLRWSQEAVLVIGEDKAAVAAELVRAERRYAGPMWGLHEGGYVGTPDVIAERLSQQIEQGMTLFVFFLADRGEGRMLQLFAEEVIPRIG